MSVWDQQGSFELGDDTASDFWIDGGNPLTEIEPCMVKMWAPSSTAAQNSHSPRDVPQTSRHLRPIDTNSSDNDVKLNSVPVVTTLPKQVDAAKLKKISTSSSGDDNIAERVVLKRSGKSTYTMVPNYKSKASVAQSKYFAENEKDSLHKFSRHDCRGTREDLPVGDFQFPSWDDLTKI